MDRFKQKTAFGPFFVPGKKNFYRSL